MKRLLLLPLAFLGFIFKDRKIARIWGIDVVLFGMLPPLLAVCSILAFHSVLPEASKDGVLGIILAAIISVSIIFLYAFALFGSILIHELAHIKVGMKHGVKVKRILLNPLGGFAELEANKASRNPQVELPMALAGPACSAAIAGSTAILSLIPIFDCSFLSFIIRLNFLLTVFNLIPAYPMDGGRILKALLAKHFDNYKSTVLANYLSIAITFGAFLPVGFLTKYKSLIFVGAFLGLLSLIDLITIKKALKDRFRLDTKNTLNLANLKKTTSVAETVNLISDFECDPNIPFFVSCEILSEIASNKKRYDYRNCAECTKQENLCLRYDNSFSMLRKKQRRKLNNPLEKSIL